MKSVVQPECLPGETLADAALDAVHGGTLPRDLIGLLRPVQRLPRLPVLPVLKPVPRWPQPPPPDPIRVLSPALS
jgi:hypothetical protein